MGKNQKRLIIALAVVLGAGGVAFASSAFISRVSGAQTEPTDNVRVVDDHKLPEQWVIDAAYGRGALSNLRAALAEIANDKPEEARKGVVVAQSLLAKIKGQSSAANAERSVKAESPAMPKSDSDLVLVHSEVRVLGDADPANSVQERLDAIRNEIEMNDHEAIIAALRSLHVPLVYTRIELPLKKTVALVNESLQALDAQDAGEAREKLLAIGNGLQVRTVQVGGGESPVEQATAKAAG